ncbi:MAG: FMN-binding protein [Proteobacteria bacterium]|nr:FMN-binding protein [Pseudomonadota bacterium]
MKGLQFAAGLFLFLSASFSVADEYLVRPEQFLAQAFSNTVPEPASLWLTGERGDTVAQILGHKPPSLRVRYWRDGEKTAWILEEIGREKPITAGFVIENGRIQDVKVLAFRESRGWEIKHDFFTKQFADVELTGRRELSAPIDNITGATLSVNAMRRMARVALFLDSELRNDAP